MDTIHNDEDMIYHKKQLKKNKKILDDIQEKMEKMTFTIREMYTYEAQWMEKINTIMKDIVVGDDDGLCETIDMHIKLLYNTMQIVTISQEPPAEIWTSLVEICNKTGHLDPYHELFAQTNATIELLKRLKTKEVKQPSDNNVNNDKGYTVLDFEFSAQCERLCEEMHKHLKKCRKFIFDCFEKKLKGNKEITYIAVTNSFIHNDVVFHHDEKIHVSIIQMVTWLNKILKKYTGDDKEYTISSDCETIMKYLIQEYEKFTRAQRGETIKLFRVFLNKLKETGMSKRDISDKYESQLTSANLKKLGLPKIMSKFTKQYMRSIFHVNEIETIINEIETQTDVETQTASPYDHNSVINLLAIYHDFLYAFADYILLRTNFLN